MAQLGVEVGEQRQHIAFELGHRRDVGDAFFVVEPVERAEQVAEGIAKLAILVGDPGEDFLADAVILGEIDAERPQAEDVGAIVAHQVDRADRIAERLRHFEALGVHREAVREDGLIRRLPARAAAFEQRRLEPAAMLVAAFEIQVGAVRAAVVADERGPAAAFEDEGVGAARIEPDVENVGDALVIGGVVAIAEIFLRARVAPRVDAGFLHRRDDAVVDERVVEILPGLAVDEQRDRHAPCALAAEHPVGAPLDHRPDAVAALGGDEAGVVDRLHRRLPQGRGVAQALFGGIDRAAFALPAPFAARLGLDMRHHLVHRHEPLRGAAEDDLGFRAPAMRIAVLVVGAGGKQRAGVAEVAADRSVGGVELGVDDRSLTAEPCPVGAIFAVALDRENGVEAVRLAEVEVILAMVGRHMDKAGAAVGGDEIARKERARAREEAAKCVHRVARYGACEFGAFERIRVTERHFVVRRFACKRRDCFEKTLLERARQFLRYDKAAAIQSVQDRKRLSDGVEIDFALRRRGVEINRHFDVIDVRAVSQSLIDRDRPRRCRPDDSRLADQPRAVRALHDLERHVDLGRDDILIFDLGLGERGLFDRRPHHRLGAAIEHVVRGEFEQFAHDRGQTLDRQGHRSAFLHVRLDLAANAEVEVGRGQRNEVLVRLDQHVAQDGHRGLRTHDVEDLGEAVAEVVAVNFEFHGALGAISRKLTKSK